MNKKDLILDSFKKILEKKNKLPTITDIAKAGFTWSQQKHYFLSFAGLKDAFEIKYPGLIDSVANTQLTFTSQRFESLRGQIAKTKKFVITTVVSECSLDLNFFNSIKTYCKINDAVPLYLPCSFKGGREKWALDPLLNDELIVFDNVELNSNLYIRSIKLNARSVDPITGLMRMGLKGSFIYASPKQRLKYVPVAKGEFPRAVMTPGCITKPKYLDKPYLNDRSSYLADHDHVMGALIVEIVDDKIFHFRQIQANKDGSFTDLGTRYNSKTCKKDNIEAIVLGDVHFGETDDVAYTAALDMIEQLKPKTIILHDTFNGRSINHHEHDNCILRSKKFEDDTLSLEGEILDTAEQIKNILDYADKIVIVKSNHDEWINDYLSKGFYVNEPWNHKYSLKLATWMLENKDPFETACSEYLTIQEKSKVKFLKMDESYKICDIEVGAHGHRGNNGAKGNIKSLDMSLGSCIIGHSHSVEIQRQAFQVGTLSKLVLGYNAGASSWTHTNCVINKDGSRQLINIIGDEWRLGD